MGDAEILRLLVQRRIFLCLDEKLNVMLTLGSYMHVIVSTSVIVLGSKLCKVGNKNVNFMVNIGRMVLTNYCRITVRLSPCLHTGTLQNKLVLFYVFWPFEHR